MVWQGVQYWADWVNEQGGLVYDDEMHYVEVITHDSSSVDTSLLATTVANVYPFKNKGGKTRRNFAK
jgi:hypothetical protein